MTKECSMMTSIAPAVMRDLIYHMRGKAVMLDSDLAELYEARTGRLKAAVNRSIKRFPGKSRYQVHAAVAARSPRATRKWSSA
jgi:hypothetical protein